MSAGKLLSLIPRIESTPTTLAKQLLESWKDWGYRSAFVRERVQSSVALQIRSLREQRNKMTQTQLAELMNKAQPWISQIENPDYGKWSVSTLIDLANAFSCDLEIKFRPFSRALYELSHQDSTYFNVPSFAEELTHLEEAAATGWIFQPIVTGVPTPNEAVTATPAPKARAESDRKPMGKSLIAQGAATGGL